MTPEQEILYNNYCKGLNEDDRQRIRNAIEYAIATPLPLTHRIKGGTGSQKRRFRRKTLQSNSAPTLRYRPSSARSLLMSTSHINHMLASASLVAFIVVGYQKTPEIKYIFELINQFFYGGILALQLIHTPLDLQKTLSNGDLPIQRPFTELETHLVGLNAFQNVVRTIGQANLTYTLVTRFAQYFDTMMNKNGPILPDAVVSMMNITTSLMFKHTIKEKDVKTIMDAKMKSINEIFNNEEGSTFKIDTKRTNLPVNIKIV